MIQANYPPSHAYLGDVEESYDVVVIGAGPSGGDRPRPCWRKRDNRVAVFERSGIPRFHVGESLIPETYWPLQRLGLIDQLKQSAFPKKFSVQFVSDGWKESAPFYFDQHNDHESAQTWQVERGDFDKMLVDNAIAKGGDGFGRMAQVLEAIFEGERAVGVRVKLGHPDNKGDHPRHERFGAKVVVDASGTSAFLANRLGTRVSDPYLKKGTVWTYFRGARRDPGKDEGATLIMQTEGKQSWFWYIPLRNDIVSVGCTGGMGYMFPPGSTAETAFRRERERCPAMESRLENAEQELGYFTTKDYSYRSSRAAGDGWVLCGDAYGFIDPVYSSGVFLGLKGGEYVAEAVHAALAANDTSAERLGTWSAEYSAGVENFRKLVYAFYAPGFSFGGFLREHPEFKQHVVDILVGDVFKPGLDDMFRAMGEVVPPVEAS